MGKGVGMIFLHFDGMTWESAEVEGDGLSSLTAISVDGNVSGPGNWVTPTMGTWGGAIIVEEVNAGVVTGQGGLEWGGVQGCKVVAIESISGILAARVPNKATSNCTVSAWRSSTRLCM